MSAQIEFIRLAAGNTFPGNSAAGSITATLSGLTPALLHRRIFANVTQPSDFTRIVAFTLDFKLRGVSQGTIGQRLIYGSATQPASAEHYWSLGANQGTAGTSEDVRKLPGGLLYMVRNATAAGVNRELCPIEVTLQIDSIVLTCTEWSSDLNTSDSANNIHVCLACLSSLHPF